MLAGGVQDRLRRSHDAQIDHLVAVAPQHNADDVLADVVHVALDRGHHDPALRLPRPFSLALAPALGFPPFRFNIRLQPRHRLPHHPRALDHLRQKHLPRAEQVPDDVHAVHQRPLDHAQRAFSAQPRLLHVLLYMRVYAVDQRVPKPLVDGQRTPCVVRATFPRLAANAVGELQKPLRGVRSPVQNHVLHRLAQRRLDLVIYGQLPRVDDAHVHPCRYRVVQEDGMDSLSDRVVAPERERDVADAAANVRAWEAPLQLPRRLDERHGVAVVLLDAGADREDVGVEYDVLRREPDPFGEDSVRPLAYLHLALERVRLSRLVERHDDDRRAVPERHSRLTNELLLSLLQ